MTFDQVLIGLKQNRKYKRSGWNGKDMFIYLVLGSTFEVNRAPLLGIYPVGTEIKYRPHIDLKDAQGMCGVWTPSQTDLFADDWEEVS